MGFFYFSVLSVIMKKNLSFLFFLLLVFSVSAQEYVVKTDDVANSLKYLSSDELEGRETGTPGIEKAAVFLEKFLSDNKVSPFFKTYRDTLSNTKKGYNIVGWIEGNDIKLKDEYIILGAHYDHIGLDNFGKDKVNNGANDDASGVVAVSEIARYFAKTRSNKRSIIIAFFDGEEKGLLGSRHLAKRLKKNQLDLYTVLCFEMIGVPMKRDFSSYITGFDKSNMSSKLNEYSGKSVTGFLPKEAQYQLFYRSDNHPFFKEFNIPSQTVSTFDFENFEFYHQPGDEFEKMDISHMTSYIQEMIPAIEKMASSATKEIKLN